MIIKLITAENDKKPIGILIPVPHNTIYSTIMSKFPVNQVRYIRKIGVLKLKSHQNKQKTNN